MSNESERIATTVIETVSPLVVALLRGTSLILAAMLVVSLLFASQLFAGETVFVQIIMPVMALGLAGTLAHGFGYRSRSPTVATVLGPWVAWPLILSSLALLVFRFG